MLNKSFFLFIYFLSILCIDSFKNQFSRYRLPSSTASVYQKRYFSRQIYDKSEDENMKITTIRNGIFRKFKSLAGNFIAVVALLLHTPGSAVARTSTSAARNSVSQVANNKQRNAKVNVQPTSKGSREKTVAKTKLGHTSSKKTVVEVEIKKDTFTLDKQQLNRIGLILVAGSTLLTLLKGDEDSKKAIVSESAPKLKVVASVPYKSPAAPKKKKVPVVMDTEEDFDLPDFKEIVEKPVSLAPTLGTEVADLVTAKDTDSRVSAEFIRSPPKADVRVDTLEDIVPAPAPSVAPPSPPSPKAASPSKGIFGRIFGQKGEGRPKTLTEALAITDEASKFRVSVAMLLSAYVPADLWEEVFQEDVPRTAVMSAEELGRSWLGTGRLSQPEAAEAFAGVSNAILVQLVDRAISLLGSAPSAPDSNSTSPLDEAMNVVIGVASGAGQAFPLVCGADATLSTPVQYNGNAKKGKVEDLYLVAVKDGMQGTLGALIGGNGPSGTQEEKEDPTIKLDKLQQVLGIKQNRRDALEQRALREMVMSGMGGGGGGVGDLNGLFDALGGGKGLGDIMGAMGEAAGGGIPGGIPGPDGANMGDLSPEQLAEMSTMAIEELKQTLREGRVTKEDVAEFEKLIGADIGQIVSNIKRTAGKAPLNAEMKDLINLFSELAEVKNRK